MHVPVYWHISVWEHLAVVFRPPNSPVLCALLSNVPYLYYQSRRLQLQWKERKSCLLLFRQLKKLVQVALPPNSTYFESLFISSLGFLDFQWSRIENLILVVWPWGTRYLNYPPFQLQLRLCFDQILFWNISGSISSPIIRFIKHYFEWYFGVKNYVSQT